MSAASGHDGADRSAPASTQAQAVKIGSYVLGETLGKGSFGKVKLATHETTGHRVAVKILNRQKIKSSQMDKKIKREITVLKMFRHPHIIRLYDVMETSSDIFMIMEYVNKGELFDYIVQNGKLSESAARRFFQQIVSGVEYCHHYQVAHRDLKPENLLLDNDLNVKIADFGLSNLMLDGDFLKTSCGSPNYAAPEVISGMLYAGPEVDVWSCGVILYALLCGRLPFDEDSIPALFQKIKAGKYNLPSSLPAGPRDIIQRILVVDPMRRMTLAEVRATEWFQAGLPPYLKMSPSQLVDDKGVDEAVVKQVASRLEGVDEEAVRAEVQAGENGQQHDISLAYNILLDAKRRKELYQLSSEEVAATGKGASGASGGGSGGGAGGGAGSASGSGSGLAGSSSLSPSSLDGGLKGSLTQSAIPQSQLKSSPVIDMMMQMSATHTKSRYNKSKFVVPSSVPAYGSGTLKSPVSCSPPFKSYIRQGLSSQVMAKSAPGVPSFAASPTNVSSSLIQGEGMVFPLDDGMGQAPQAPAATPLAGSDGIQDDLGSMDGYLAQQGCGWRLGLMSEKRSSQIMNAIYDVLVEKKLVWKVLNPFHLSVRPQSYKAGGIKIGIRLYRMHDSHDKGVLIDLSRIDGNGLHTMDLISELHDCFQCRVA